MDWAHQASLSFTVSQSFLRFMSTESVMLYHHLIPCCSLLLLPSVFPSIIVFSNESALHIRWPKYWSFSISPSNEYSGLISFRIGWFDLFAVQGTLNSLLQHHSLKASILWCSEFFMVQLSHPLDHISTSQVAQTVKNPPAMRETWVWSLSWEDPLKDMATQSSILAWRIPWTEEPGGLYSPWGYKESDTTEQLTLSHPYLITGKTITFRLYGPLLAKKCLCFLICYWGLS